MTFLSKCIHTSIHSSQTPACTTACKCISASSFIWRLDRFCSLPFRTSLPPFADTIEPCSVSMQRCPEKLLCLFCAPSLPTPPRVITFRADMLVVKEMALFFVLCISFHLAAHNGQCCCCYVCTAPSTRSRPGQGWHTFFAFSSVCKESFSILQPNRCQRSDYPSLTCATSTIPARAAFGCYNAPNRSRTYQHFPVSSSAFQASQGAIL